MVEVPRVVRNKAAAAGAEWWVTGLPDLVAELERDWQLVLGTPFDDATEAFVAPVSLEDGADAVLKLVLPLDKGTDAVAHEVTVLGLADGDGCARLFRHDAARGALLMERLGPSLHELGLPLQRRLEILSSVASRVWRPARECGLPSGAEKGHWLSEFIATTWEETDRPCTERAVAHALDCAASRVAAHDDERAVLVHGDVHEWNALRTGSEFKLIDPDGLHAEAEYDLGVLMREDPLDLLERDPQERSRWLAARTGLDAEAIWEWGVVERVSTGLLCMKVDLQPVGRQMLTLADRIAFTVL